MITVYYMQRKGREVGKKLDLNGDPEERKTSILTRNAVLLSVP